MCGLVGIISNSKTGFYQKDADLFEEMLYCDAVRGLDSTGVFGVRKTGNVNLLKEASDPLTFITTQDFKNFQRNVVSDFYFVAGHNRKATRGSINDESAHPFHEGDVVLIHNGTLWDHKKHADVDVDSHAIAILINKEGHEKALQEINGAYALVWYDNRDKKLRLARNKERPLFYVEAAGITVFGSELNMLYWLMTRNNLIVKEENCHQLDPDFIYEWDLETLRMIKKELPKKKVVTPLALANPEKNTTGKQTHGNLSVASANPIKMGDKIDFLWNDYKTKKEVDSKDWPTYKTAENWDMRLEGVGRKIIKDVKIHAYCNDKKDWQQLSKSGVQRVTGKVVAMAYDSHGKLARVDIAELEPSISAVALNGTIVTPLMWSSILHTCDICQKEIELEDIRESYLSIQKTDKKFYRKKKLVCPDCYNTQRKVC